MKTGTSHFVNEDTAVRYYHKQGGFTRADVRRKAKAGEIHYGPPTVSASQHLELIDSFTRYAIVDND
jgi:hypothetical protein